MIALIKRLRLASKLRKERLRQAENERLQRIIDGTDPIEMWKAYAEGME